MSNNLNFGAIAQCVFPNCTSLNMHEHNVEKVNFSPNFTLKIHGLHQCHGISW